MQVKYEVYVYPPRSNIENVNLSHYCLSFKSSLFAIGASGGIQTLDLKNMSKVCQHCFNDGSLEQTDF